MPVIIKLKLQLSHVFSLGLFGILLHGIVNSGINFQAIPVQIVRRTISFGNGFLVEYLLYFLFKHGPEIWRRAFSMAYRIEFQTQWFVLVFFQFVFAYKALFSH